MLKLALDTDYSDYEVIFVDNNSTNNNWEYAKEKYCNNSRIKFMRNASNLGYIEGNKCMLACP
jgi:GT2 family glycosyltransferase